MLVPSAAPARLCPAEADAVRAAIESVLIGGSWVLGETVAAFERAFADYLDLPPDREVVGVGNGSDALAIAFAALGLPAGSGVLVAVDEGGYAATAAAQCGLRVFVMDVDPDLGVPTSATAAAAAAWGDVSAIVVTHLHGDAVSLGGPGGLDEWRRQHGVLLVEDCAQAHGLRVDGQHVGLVGEAATFSFYPTKNLGAVGDGGAVVLDSARAATARALRQYGWVERYRVDVPGGRNSRLDALQAAILTARLPFLDANNERRRRIASRYRDLLPMYGDPATTVAHHAVVVSESQGNRDALQRSLAREGVATSINPAWLVNEMPGLATHGPPTPVAAQRRDRMLSLPCFPEMLDSEIEHVCAVVAEHDAARVACAEDAVLRPAPLRRGLRRLSSWDDDRGSLVPITVDEAGFEIARVFVVTAPAEGTTRGGHSVPCHQLIVLTSGHVSVCYYAPDRPEQVVELARPGDAVLLLPGDYIIYTLGPHASVTVLADKLYEERLP